MKFPCWLSLSQANHPFSRGEMTWLAQGLDSRASIDGEGGEGMGLLQSVKTWIKDVVGEAGYHHWIPFAILSLERWGLDSLPYLSLTCP